MLKKSVELEHISFRMAIKPGIILAISLTYLLTTVTGRQVFIGGHNCGVNNGITTMTVGGRTVVGCTVVQKPEELYKLEPGKIAWYIYTLLRLSHGVESIFFFQCMSNVRMHMLMFL